MLRAMRCDAMRCDALCELMQDWVLRLLRLRAHFALSDVVRARPVRAPNITLALRTTSRKGIAEYAMQR